MASKRLFARPPSPSFKPLYLSTQSARDLSSTTAAAALSSSSSFLSKGKDKEEDWIVPPSDPAPEFSVAEPPPPPSAEMMASKGEGERRVEEHSEEEEEEEEEEGDHILPPYTNSIYLATLCRRKREFHAAFEKTRRGRRGWEAVWLVLDGTALRVHKPTKEEETRLTMVEHQRRQREEQEQSKEKAGVRGRARDGETVGPSRFFTSTPPPPPLPQATTTNASSSSSAPLRRPHLFHSSASDSQIPLFRLRRDPLHRSTSSPLASHPVLSSSSSPASASSRPPTASTTRTHDPRQQEEEGAGDGSVHPSPPFLSPRLLSTPPSSLLPPIKATPTTSTTNPCIIDPQHHPLLKQYHLRDSICTLASTDKSSDSQQKQQKRRRKHVVRFILCKGKQFLIQFQSKREVAQWLQAMTTAAPLALDLDERPMPDPARYPQRRRIVLLLHQSTTTAAGDDDQRQHQIGMDAPTDDGPNSYRLLSRTVAYKRLNGPAPHPLSHSLTPSVGGNGNEGAYLHVGVGSELERRRRTRRPSTAPGHLEPSTVHEDGHRSSFVSPHNTNNAGDNNEDDDGGGDIADVNGDGEMGNDEEGGVGGSEEEDIRMLMQRNYSDDDEEEEDSDSDSEMMDHLPIPRPPPSILVHSLSSVAEARRRGVQL
ncbi:hypothetical protein FRC17_008673 [Serendipita sp. 399]|nr:hypothetical protein FRC17_008673 [Serendipita sp. 399]